MSNETILLDDFTVGTRTKKNFIIIQRKFLAFMNFRLKESVYQRPGKKDLDQVQGSGPGRRKRRRNQRSKVSTLHRLLKQVKKN